MFADKTKVLLVLSRDVVDEARVLAGKATTTLKLPVSLQIVLRALIAEGLTRHTDPVLLANVAEQARAVRDIRRAARRAEQGDGERQRLSANRLPPRGALRPRRRP